MLNVKQVEEIMKCYYCPSPLGVAQVSFTKILVFTLLQHVILYQLSLAFNLKLVQF